jgi:hypothetical protein
MDTVQKIYNILDGANNMDNDTVTTVSQAAAAVTNMGSTANTANTTIGMSPKIAAAINQLLENKTAIMLQMLVMSFMPARTQATWQFMARKLFQVPSIKQLAILMQQQPFHVGAFNSGHSTVRGGGGQGHRWGQGGLSCNPFVDYMHTAGTQAMTPGQLVQYGALPAQNMIQQHCNPSHSNTYKCYNNLNLCFSCSFDVEDEHTSLTCPFRELNHQTSYMRKNVQLFIVAGYDLCMKGMQKMLLLSSQMM